MDWPPPRLALPRARRLRDQLEVGPRPELAQPAEDDGVARHREQDQEAEHRVAPELADLQAEQALLERADHDGAEHGAEHRSRPAEDVDAADHHRGDRLQLQPVAGLHGDVAEARRGT